MQGLTSTTSRASAAEAGDVALYYPCRQAFFVKGRKGGRPLYLLFDYFCNCNFIILYRTKRDLRIVNVIKQIGIKQ
jgi:hypothetical protein